MEINQMPSHSIWIERADGFLFFRTRMDWMRINLFVRLFCIYICTTHMNNEYINADCIWSKQLDSSKRWWSNVLYLVSFKCLYKIDFYSSLSLNGQRLQRDKKTTNCSAEFRERSSKPVQSSSDHHAYAYFLCCVYYYIIIVVDWPLINENKYQFTITIKIMSWNERDA